MKGTAAALVLCAALVARAQAPATDTDQARKHFEAGSKAFNLGEFKRAVDEYKAAYNSKADPVFLYNIAQAYRLDGNLPQSLFFYKSYLSNSPKAPNRREVEQRIHQLEVQVQEQRAVTTAPPNTTVPPTGTITTAPEPVEPPRAEPPKVAEPATRTDLTPTVTATAQPKDSGPRPLYKKWWVWTIVGGVAVGAALGIGLGLGLQPTAPASQLGTTRVF
ncbi:MAG: TonB-dependent receptor [Myxococcales bacterium]|nr:TonB-dependent receptor [Myxococcales bacterium]